MTTATKTESQKELTSTAAWSRLQALSEQMPSPVAERELADLFAAGTPADVDGQTDGLLVGFLSDVPDLELTGRVVLGLAKPVLAVTTPWLGKKFDQRSMRGTNSVTGLVPLLTKLIAPSYRMHKTGDHWEGFEMLNRIEESVVVPGTQVLVLDYEAPEVGNPWPVNQIRDEAVQIAPGVYLGAKIWHQPDGYRQLAYWAAKTPAAA